MTGTTDALVLDLVEWVAREPRVLFRSDRDVADLMPAPDDLEDAVDRGYVARQPSTGAGVRIAITARGAKLLRDNGR